MGILPTNNKLTKDITPAELSAISILESLTNQAMAITDDAGSILYVNKVLTELAKSMDAKSYLDKSFLFDLLNLPEWVVLNTIEQIENDHREIRQELFLQIKDDKKGFLMTANALEGTSDKLFLFSFLNLHEYIDAKNLAAIVDHTEDHATIKDLDLKIVNANKSLVKDSGYSSVKDLIGKTDKDLFGDTEHVQKYMEDDRKAQNLKRGEFIEHEEYFIYPDGRIITTLVKKFPVFDANDNLVGTANISRNISYLKQIEEQLRESEKKYKDLIENQGEGLGIIDKLGSFTFVNKAAEKIFDIEEGKMVGRNIKEFVSKSHVSVIDEEIRKISGGFNTSFELKIVVNEEIEKYLIVTATPNTTENILPDGAFIILRDITARKYAERALKNSEEKLQELNQTKDKFFSIIAHDLKNPFGSILGFSDMIVRKVRQKDYKKVETWAGFIRQASRQGYELLENLLEWSRSQSGAMEIYPEFVEIGELVLHNFDVVRQAAQKKEIELKLNLSQKLNVFIDEDMINTVIRNLLSNAIKFSKRGSTISVLVKRKRFFAEVAIQDSGVGIEKEHLEKLFRISHNVTTSGTENEEGTGLGLILCKEFIEKNKGKIWAESIVGKGSTFNFTLPLNDRE